MRYEWAMIYRRDGKEYVHQRLETLDPNEARRGHESSCEFLWVTAGMDAPYVTPLEAVDERGRARIREGCAPGQDPRRVYKAVPFPADLDAAAPRADAPTTRAQALSKGHPWGS